MKHKHLYSLLDTTFTTIHVVFSNAVPAANTGRAVRPNEARSPLRYVEDDAPADSYVYKSPLDANVSVGDHVVVFTPREGLRIAKVVQVDAAPVIDVDAPFDYRWIVQRIDKEAYQERVDREERFSATMLEVERTKQREALVNSFQASLPEGSAARALFDATAGMLRPVAPVTPPFAAGVDLTSADTGAA